MNSNRRQFATTAAGLAGAAATWSAIRRHGPDVRKARSRVAILSVEDYSDALETLLLAALRDFGLNVRGRNVLLKSNLVEHLPGAPVNTNPKLIGAAATCSFRLGASRVVVGEGQGHERDTEMVVCETGLEQELGDPLRRRSLYLRFEHPTIERETKILGLRTTTQHSGLHGELAGFAHALRGYKLEKPPSIAEMLDLAEALRLLDADGITADMRDILLPFIAKTESDRCRLLLRDGFESLVFDTRRYCEELSGRGASA